MESSATMAITSYGYMYGSGRSRQAWLAML